MQRVRSCSVSGRVDREAGAAASLFPEHQCGLDRARGRLPHGGIMFLPSMSMKLEDLMNSWLKKCGSSILILAILAFTGAGCHSSRAVSSTPMKGASDGELKKLGELLELIDKNYVRAVDFEDLTRGALEGMIKVLDPHSTYLTKEMYKEMQADRKGVFGGVGLVVSIKNGALTVVSPLEGTPACRSGILPGDVIVGIDGQDARGLSIIDAVRKLRGPINTSTVISIVRPGIEEPLVFSIRREIIKVKSVRHHLLGDGMGYVRISSFQETTSDELKKSLAALKSQGAPLRGLILDLRNNPGGLMDQAVSAADLFLDDGIIITIKGRGFEEVYRARKKGAVSGIPMIVLVNGGSASGSEILAGALQDNGRAVLLGTRTFGKGVMQRMLPLKDGSALKLTAAEYFTPRGGLHPGYGFDAGFHPPLRQPGGRSNPGPGRQGTRGSLGCSPRGCR